MKSKLTLSFMRSISLVAVLVGAVGSIGLVLYKGQDNPSVLLIALFAAWVFSPFAGLLISDRISGRWAVSFRMTLYILMLVLSILSLLVYSGVFSIAGTKTAFVFLIIPLISWVSLGTLLLIGRSKSDKSDPEKNNISTKTLH